MFLDRLDQHPYFSAWTDPESGVVSYILTHHETAVQKSFYFVNTSLSPDGRWLWLEAAYPPAPVRHLAALCLDPAAPELRVFPHTTINAETPVQDREGNIYFTMSEVCTRIWKMDLDGTLEVAFDIPNDFLQNRKVQRVGTHLTLSADEKLMLIDGKIGNTWYVATVDMHTGAFNVIKEFTRHYNHSQFSPIDPTLFSIAQDHWVDPYTGVQHGYDQRIWLMSTDGERFEAAEPDYYHSAKNAGNQVCHEWWADDGTLCWIRYKEGAYEMDVHSKEIKHIWKRPLCHAHCDASRRYWVADQSPYFWPEPCQVLFYDRKADQDIAIVTGMPEPFVPRHPYHVDPHPRFINQGSHVLYTTTVLNGVDVALTPVNQDALRFEK